MWLGEETATIRLCFTTSLQARSADLPASPAGLLGRFAPSGFALRARIALASRSLRSRAFRASRSRKFSKKSVSQSTQNALKRVKMQKKLFYAFHPLRAERRSANFERRSVTLATS